jgi:hypothetical protein
MNRQHLEEYESEEEDEDEEDEDKDVTTGRLERAVQASDAEDRAENGGLAG